MSVQIFGLDEGTSYGMASSMETKGVENQPSAANRLNLVQEVGAKSRLRRDTVRGT
jgi:hypothetical protein